MTSPRLIRFRRRPSMAGFVLRALRSGRLRRSGGLPGPRAIWTGHRAGGRALAELLRHTNQGSSASLPLLYPHVIGLPLQMVVLTLPSFPVPIWRILQIRNHVLLLRPIPVGAVLDFGTAVSDHRVLEKGIEVDLHTTVHEGGELVWESLNTFFSRGRFGEAEPPSNLAIAPDASGPVVAQWRTPPGGGWRFGRLSGDLNGIHLSDAYARAFGFRKALHHPQVVLGQCLARLERNGFEGTQRLDAWLKGPVYTASDVKLATREETAGASFALFAGEERPAIVGRWRSVPEGSRLIPEGDDSR